MAERESRFRQPAVEWWIGLGSVLLVGIGVRVVFHLGLGEDFLRYSVSHGEVPYLAALSDHFFEYLLHAHVKPPLLHVIHAFPAWLVGGAERQASALLFIVGAMNLLATVFMFLAATALGARPFFAGICAILASVSWLVFDSAIFFHDAPAFFFLALFVLCSARVVQGAGRTGYLWLGISGGLLIGQLTVQSAVVPVVAVLLAFVFPAGDIRERLKRLAVGVGLPVLVLLAVCARNYVSTGIMATSTLGGHTALLFVMMKTHWNAPLVAMYAREAGAPTWYLWCFENPWISPEMPNPEIQRVWLPTVGGCVPQRAEAPNDASKPDWPFLLRQLEVLGAEEAVIEDVRKDLAIAEMRPYLRTGVATRWGTNWAVQYNRISGKVASHVFWADPRDWFVNAKYVHGNMFTTLGPAVFPNLRKLYEPLVPIITTPFYNTAAAIFEAMTRYSYLALPVVVIALLGSFAALVFVRAAALTQFNPAVYWFTVVALFVGAMAAAATYIHLLDWFYYAWPRRRYRILPLGYTVMWGLVAAHAALAAAPHSKQSQPAWLRAGKLERLIVSRKSLAMWAILIVPLLSMGFIFSTMVGTENDRFFSHLGPHLCVMAAVLLTLMVDATRRGAAGFYALARSRR